MVQNILKFVGSRIWAPYPAPVSSPRFEMVLAYPDLRRSPFLRKALYAIVLLALTNWLTWRVSNVHFEQELEEESPLYLIEEAAQYVRNIPAFEAKVRESATALDVPPEWLMAVMYHESHFNPTALNQKGSGATGLIQFMVPAVRDLNDRLGTQYYMSDVRKMSAVNQLELVREYLQTTRERYGEYHSLTDLYLAVLYPRAMGKSDSYVLFSRMSKAYQQNAGMDENGDGRVTVGDVDSRLARMFPIAYEAEKQAKADAGWFAWLQDKF
ncbi:MAG: hypothetical protein EAZ89_11180 [Bacteroidetes bacterium]|nr:MAG: hypothetical protein EAZ89_11180 [Bacteroidota bacterium]